MEDGWAIAITPFPSTVEFRASSIPSQIEKIIKLF